MYWDTIKVVPLENCEIYVELENGDKGVFDLKPYLDFGVFKELKDEHYFRQVSIAYGAVTWPNEQDIAPETLLAGLKPLDERTQNYLKTLYTNPTEPSYPMTGENRVEYLQ